MGTYYVMSKAKGFDKANHPIIRVSAVYGAVAVLEFSFLIPVKYEDDLHW